MGTPSDWSLITSGAPSTRYSFPAVLALVAAPSMPKTDCDLWYSSLSEELMYLHSDLPSNALAVKPSMLEYLSLMGIMRRFLKMQ